MLWCIAPVLSSMAQHLFYLLATNLLPHLPSCSALPQSLFHPFPPLSLTSPFAPNLYPAGRQWPNCPITLTNPHMLFPYLCLFSFPHFTQFFLLSTSLSFPLFTRMSVHLSLFSTTPSIQMPIFPSHYSLSAGLPVPCCFWLYL